MSCGLPFSSQVEPSTYAFISLLAPFPADNVKEQIVFNLPQNQPLITIPLSVQKLSNNLGMTGPVFYNITDSTPLIGLTFTPTTFSSSSITGLVNANINSANYWVMFVAFVKGN